MSELQENTPEGEVSNVSQLVVATSQHVGADQHEADDNELAAMELATHDLAGDGALTPQQADEDREAIAKVRRTFRDLTPTQRKNLISKRVNSGKNMMESTMDGSTAVIHDLKLNHGILKNRFASLVPYLDRALVNMDIFGEENFGKVNNNERLKALSTGTKEFYEAAKAARITAEKMVEEFKAKFDEQDEDYFAPEVPFAALETKIHIHSKVSMYHLRGYLEMDRLLSACAWLEWNGCRTTKEISSVTRPLYMQATAVGRRGYLTFIDLMRTRSEKARAPAITTELAA